MSTLFVMDDVPHFDPYLEDRTVYIRHIGDFKWGVAAVDADGQATLYCDIWRREMEQYEKFQAQTRTAWASHFR